MLCRSPQSSLMKARYSVELCAGKVNIQADIKNKRSSNRNAVNPLLAPLQRLPSGPAGTVRL